MSHLLTVIRKQWFLISLVMVLVFGFEFSDQLSFLADARSVRSGVIAAVLFMTALGLETNAIWRAVQRPGPTLLASALNYGLLPIAAWVIAGWFLEGPLKLGVLVVAAAPSTLASAAVWTRRAGGNDTIAVMVTVVTNLGCVLLMPFWLTVTADKALVTIDVVPMIEKLAWLVVLPMVLGQLIRRVDTVAAWSIRRRGTLSVISQVGILFIVFSGAVGCGLQVAQQEGGGGLPWDAFGRMIFVVGSTHAVVLFAGQMSGPLLGWKRSDWIAVGFAGSQKTLPVALHAATMLGGGLMILSIIAYHVVQLFIDTLVADRLAAAGSGSLE